MNELVQILCYYYYYYYCCVFFNNFPLEEFAKVTLTIDFIMNLSMDFAKSGVKVHSSMGILKHVCLCMSVYMYVFMCVYFQIHAYMELSVSLTGNIICFTTRV